MTNIILNGYMGRMGQALIELINKMDNAQVICGVDINRKEDLAFKTFRTFKECNIVGDVIIDFSNDKALEDLIDFAVENKIPTVIATTALSSKIEEKIKVAEKDIPVFISANMSIGINVMKECLKKITEVIENDFHIEIVEKHHSLKKDSPSGTALLLADSIKEASSMERNYVYGRHGIDEKREINEIGIHAVRGGTIPGEHTAIFAGDDEIIEVKHTALSRKIFAKGAIEAALFIENKEAGSYTMSDMIK